MQYIYMSKQIMSQIVIYFHDFKSKIQFITFIMMTTITLYIIFDLFVGKNKF